MLINYFYLRVTFFLAMRRHRIKQKTINLMKKRVYLIFAILSLSFSLNAQTYPPACVVTQPYSNAYFKQGTDVDIHVYASDIGKTTNNGTVTKVEFYNGATKLGEATTHTNFTYKYKWSCVPAGTYTIKAKATNDRGVSFTSVGQIITVGANNVSPKGMSSCKGKYLANIIAGSPNTQFNTLWNGITSENSCKWGSVEGNRNVMNWGGADVSYNQAKNNNMMFRYHAAVWAAQYPSWILNLSTADAKAEIVQYMEAIAARYPLIDQIDVLNEQLGNHQADNQKFRNLLGGGSNVSATDFGWQTWLFTEARRIFPNTKLILNDYGLENDQGAINQQLNLLKVLRDRGIVDGFGTQAHCFNIDGMSAAALKNALDLMDNSGLPTYVTELDLNGRSEDNNNNGAVQSTSYQTHFPVYWEHPSVAGITLWGYVTGATWIGGTGLMSSSGVDKPAMTWLKQYVSGRTSTGYPMCATGACVNPGQAPTVSLTSPSNNASFTTLQSINLTATASDADGTIAKVEFYDGATLLNSDASAPYSFVWSNLTVGSHIITAIASDNSGLTKTSTAITINVSAAQAPFKGTALPIPGRIEAEDYDLGGEGVAYHEENTNGNEGLATYRNDQVDVETTKDASGTYNVGYILQNEWLEYTVNVANTGLYTIDLRMATSGAGKTIHIEFDGVNISDAITVPNTGDWQTWATVSVTGISLTQGQHIMRVAFDASYMNLNYLNFKKEIETGFEDERMEISQVYPNPFTNEVYVKLNGDFQYELMDISGKILESGTAFDVVNLVGDYPKGMYVLKLLKDNKSQTLKLIKE